MNLDVDFGQAFSYDTHETEEAFPRLTTGKDSDKSLKSMFDSESSLDKTRAGQDESVEHPSKGEDETSTTDGATNDTPTMQEQEHDASKTQEESIAAETSPCVVETEADEPSKPKEKEGEDSLMDDKQKESSGIIEQCLLLKGRSESKDSLFSSSSDNWSDSSADGGASHQVSTLADEQQRENEVNSHEQEAQSYEQEAQSHEQVAQSHEQEAQSHEQEAQSHEQEAQSHEQEAQSHEQEAQNHEQEAQSHEQEAQSHEQQVHSPTTPNNVEHDHLEQQDVTPHPFELSSFTPDQAQSDDTEQKQPTTPSTEQLNTTADTILMLDYEEDDDDDTDSDDEDEGSLLDNSDSRVYLVRELKDSERKYLDYLILLFDAYIKRLEVKNTIWKRSLLAKREIATVFSYLTQIKVLSGEFLSKLETTQEKALTGEYSDVKQRTNQYVENSCSVITNFSSLFKLYAQYAATYYRSTYVFVDFEKDNEQFKEFNENTKRKLANGLSLEALMIMPIQRLPRYELFLKEISKMAVEYPIRHALLSVIEANKFIEEAVRVDEDRQQLVELQRRISIGKGEEVDLISGHRMQGRKLLKSGTIVKASKGGEKLESITVFLFTDMLIYTEGEEKKQQRKSLKLRRMISASELKVVNERDESDNEAEQQQEKEAEDGDMAEDETSRVSRDLKFTLETPLKTLEFYANSKEERKEWVALIKSISNAAASQFSTSYIQQQMTPPASPPLTKPKADVEELIQKDVGASAWRNVPIEKAPKAATPPNPEAEKLLELLSSLFEKEREYARSLSTIVEIFVKPMLDFSDGASLPSPSKITDESLVATKKTKKDQVSDDRARRKLMNADVGVCLSSLIQLDILHAGLVERFDPIWTMFFMKLEDDENIGANEGTEEAALLFDTLCPLLRLYFSYLVRFELVQQLMKKKVMLGVKRVLERNERAEGVPLEVYLQLPKQRLESYRDSIETLLELLPPTCSAVRSLKESLGSLSKVFDDLELAREERTKVEDLVDIQEALVSSKSSILNRVFDAKNNRNKNYKQKELEEIFDDKKGRNREMGSGCLPTKSLFSSRPNIVHEGRVLLKQGELVKICNRKTPTRYTFFLFNDSLMYCTKVMIKVKGESHAQFKYHRSFKISECFAIPSPLSGAPPSPATMAAKEVIQEEVEKPLPELQQHVGGEVVAVKRIEETATRMGANTPNPYFDFNPTSFKIRTTTKSFVVLSDNEEEKKAWCELINQQASHELGNDIKAPAPFLFYEPVLYPLRMLKGAEKKCLICKDGTSSLAHCKVCGIVCCKACSRSMVFMKGIKKKGRICNKCEDNVCYGIQGK